MYFRAKSPIRIRKTIVNSMSPYQHILLTHTNHGLSLFLNGEIQFVENQERIYHHALAVEPLLRSPLAKRALIMGGGDGLAVRSMLETRPMEVFLCELDPLMVKVFSWEPRSVRMNKKSLSKCKVVIGDAKQSLQVMPSNFFDVVVADFPDYNLDTADLYGPRLYNEVFRVMKRGGVLSVYPNQGHDEVRSALSGYYAGYKYYPIDLPSMGHTQLFNAIKR